MKIIVVAGARPNFMKIAPLIKEMSNHEEIESVLVHTGQHYDDKMSKLFFEELQIPKPDINLEVGSGSHAVQTAEIMKRFEPVLIDEKPSLIVVVGDVNSTIACALTAKKLCVQVAHVEAGLRSFDRTMPEEINRILTDAISDYLFITEKSAEENLLREGIPLEKIFFVGNLMIDTLMQHKEKAMKSNILNSLGFSENLQYALLTLHRPSNVDDKERFNKIIEALHELSKRITIIFPSHPRTRKRITEFGLDGYFQTTSYDKSLINDNGIYLTEPLGYIDFLKMMNHARIVLTDSGGIQEETTILGIPCVTLRENTERPVTVYQGTNVIAGIDSEKIVKESLVFLNRKNQTTIIPDLWDGKAAQRIVNILLNLAQESLGG